MTLAVVLRERCGAFTASRETCDGRVLVVGDDGSVVEGECEKCGRAFGLPAQQASPEVKRRRLLEQAGIPERFSGRRFEETPENASALVAVREWVSGFAGSPLPAPLLWGEAGRGKSHLLAAIARRLVIEHSISVMFASARGLLRDLQRFEGGDAQRAWERAVSVRVLVLDDLGAQRQTDWRDDQIADLIDQRYETERPIVAATNFAPSMWPEMVDERTRSRIAGMTFPVQLSGPDRRQSSGKSE